MDPNEPTSDSDAAAAGATDASPGPDPTAPGGEQSAINELPGDPNAGASDPIEGPSAAAPASSGPPPEQGPTAGPLQAAEVAPPVPVTHPDPPAGVTAMPGEATEDDSPSRPSGAPVENANTEPPAAPAPAPATQPKVIASSGAPASPNPEAAGAGAGAPAPVPTEAGVAGTAPVPAPAGDVPGLRSGQIVEGRVTRVDAEEAVVEMPDGSVGVIGKRHLTPTGQTAPTELLSVGDLVEAAVLVRDDPKGRLVLSRAWALKQKAWEAVEAAKAANKPITGRVTGLVKGGMVVDVGTRAFLPASQVDLHHVEDLASFVGQEIEALVHEADKVNDKVVLSRRNLLRQEQRARANDVVASLAPGQVHRGRVALLTDFGAFVEIGGVRGLVHLSELSWSRVEHATDVLSPGDEVDVKVLGIKPGKKLSLSIRALSPDPLAGLQAGQILSGVVTRLADFGAFVRVGEGAEGLVHVTELAEYRVHAPEEVVTPGDEVLVKVLRIDRKRRRLDLSVNQALLS